MIFHQPNPRVTLIKNPFNCDVEKIENLSGRKQDEFIDLMYNGTMKNIFNDGKLIVFWFNCAK